MSISRIGFSAATAISFLSVSTPALAGTGSGSVSFAPSSLVGAAGATAVPTMTNGVLIALGLMLLVVAVRALQGHERRQRFFSVLLLGGGVAVAGFGIERSFATNSPIVTGGNQCTQASSASYVTGGRSDGSLNNQCTVPLTITGYTLNCNVGQTEVQVSPVGTEIAPGNSASLNYCASPDT